MTRFIRNFQATAVCAALSASAGCHARHYQPLSAYSPPYGGYFAKIRVESVVSGGQIKVNGMLVDLLPGYATLEVDETGVTDRQWVISLSTNILPVAVVTIEPGQAVPAKIFFERTGPVVTGQAVVIKPQ